MKIAVVGTHSWSAPPERGTVHITVDVEGPDRAETVQVATALVDALAADLHRLRAGADAPVSWYSVGPLVTRTWRPYQERGQAAPQFAAGASLQATFTDFTALSDATLGWAQRDGVQIGDVFWTLTDATEASLEATALTRAVDQARARALAIAQASGYAEVTIEEVADPGLLPSEQPRPVAMMAASFDRSHGKRESSGATIAPEDVRGEAVIHARFSAAR